MNLLKVRLTPRQYIVGLVLGFLVALVCLNYFLKPNYAKEHDELFTIFLFTVPLYFVFIASCRLRDAGSHPWLSLLIIFLGPVGLGAIIFNPSAKD